MRQHGIRQTALQIGEALGQCGAKPVEFVNLRMLFDDGLIEHVKQIFLMRELALECDDSLFGVLRGVLYFVGTHEHRYCQSAGENTSDRCSHRHSTSLRRTLSHQVSFTGCGVPAANAAGVSTATHSPCSGSRTEA